MKAKVGSFQRLNPTVYISLFNVKKYVVEAFSIILLVTQFFVGDLTNILPFDFDKARPCIGA